MIDIAKLNWRKISASDNIPPSVENYLIDTESLTAKLKDKFSDFAVNVVNQSEDQPFANEVEIIKSSASSVIREVELMGGGKPVVFARSIIPITNDTKSILKIGSKPLGEILFNNPDINRGELEITNSSGLWGRRSIFTLGDTNILVSEFFLDELYA